MIAVIACIANKNVIGKDGTMPWSIPNELDSFKRITSGSVVIMGKNTYLSIGHPLKDRVNVVVSSTMKETDGIIVVRSLKEALLVREDLDRFIIGGADLYKEAIPISDRLYLTRLDLDVVDADTFFCEFDASDYDVTMLEEVIGEYSYKRYLYTKKENEMLFLYYPKCSTCQKAKKWLDANNIDYTERLIVEDNPSYDELKSWYEKSGLDIKRFFNTSGVKYKELDLKNKLGSMSLEEKLKLLATDGKLVKRPLVVKGDTILTGFKEEEWKLLK